MKAEIDKSLCTGCGLCCDLCKEVFAYEKGKAAVKVDIIPENMEDKCRQTADACPFEAIKIIEEKGTAD